MSTLGAHRAQVDSAAPTRETAHVACWVVRLLVLVDAAVATVLIGAVRLYQLLVSPLLGPVCRYAPSCSSYGAQALAGHGAVRGSALTLWRVARCHPWSSGGWDPVPPGRTPSWRQECRHERRRHAPRPSSRPPAACEHQPSPEPARTP